MFFNLIQCLKKPDFFFKTSPASLFGVFLVLLGFYD